MRKESSLPVRLDTDAKVRLVEIGDVTGLTVSSLVRMLVKSFIATYDSNGGRVVLPPEWKTTTVKAPAKASVSKEIGRKPAATKSGPRRRR